MIIPNFPQCILKFSHLRFLYISAISIPALFIYFSHSHTCAFYILSLILQGYTYADMITPNRVPCVPTLGVIRSGYLRVQS